jgi:transposase
MAWICGVERCDRGINVNEKYLFFTQHFRGVCVFYDIKNMHAQLEELRRQNAEQAALIATLRDENQALRAENQLLQRKVQFLIHRLFGRTSEKLDPNQLELLLGDASVTPPDEDPPEPPTPPRPRAPRDRKPRLPADLPTEEIVIDPEAVKQNPTAYQCIGEEVTEELDVTPSRYFRRRTIRRKYTSKTNRALPPVVAPLPPRLVEGGYASPGLVTDILLKKYVDHLPLFRQEQILRTRHGIELSRQTMCDWVRIAADWLKPVYNHIREELRQGGYLQIDETPVRYCQEDGGGSSQGYFWVYHHPGKEVLFEWHTSRAAACLDGMLQNFRGIVQCDGYGAYASYAKNHDAIQLSCCWAHARRKFHEARHECPAQAGWFLRQIGLLYQIESELRGQGPQLRQAVRSAQSAMVLVRIEKMLRLKLNQHRPTSGMGSAIAYTLSLWPHLLRYRDDGRLEIDNNLVENAIRPTAIGKKNWLFIGHPDAGERSAIIYTLLENCKRLGINPRDYLLDVLTRLPAMTNHQTYTLTPRNWLAARKKQAA